MSGIKNMGVADFAYAINKAYERGYSRGRTDQQSQYASARQIRTRHTVHRPLSIDEVMRRPSVQAAINREAERIIAAMEATSHE